MLNKVSLIFLIVVCVGLVIFVFLYFYPLRGNSDVTDYASSITASSSAASSSLCGIKEEEKAVNGNSLEPLVKSGETIKIIFGFYACNPVVRDDIVAYQYAGNSNPIVKIARGVPGDKWSLEKSGDYFLIQVNGDIIKNSAGREYKIPATNKMLPLYAGDYPVIPENSYLILGDGVNGSLDSSSFGFADGNNILGKVVLPSASQ